MTRVRLAVPGLGAQGTGELGEARALQVRPSDRSARWTTWGQGRDSDDRDPVTRGRDPSGLRRFAAWLMVLRVPDLILWLGEESPSGPGSFGGANPWLLSRADILS